MRTDISESKIGVIVGGGALSLAYIAACTALQSKILNKVGECGDIDNEILAHIPKNGDDPSDYYLELLRKSKSCHERLAEFYKASESYGCDTLANLLKLF